MNDEVSDFLDKEVPYTGGVAWRDWEDECSRLGPGAPAIFLSALRAGPEHTHYAAVLGLRIYGYEAWGYGDGDKRFYRVTAPGRSVPEIINPLSKAPDYDDPDIWEQISEGI